MGIGAFAEAGLVPVAYAQVESDGSSADSNSGVTVTRSQAGAYNIALPSDKALPDKEAYPVVTLWNSPGCTINITPLGPSDQRYYLVNVVNVATGLLADAKFSFVLFRTISPLGNGVPA
jgi:hypothetical protein